MERATTTDLFNNEASAELSDMGHEDPPLNWKKDDLNPSLSQAKVGIVVPDDGGREWMIDSGSGGEEKQRALRAVNRTGAAE